MVNPWIRRSASRRTVVRFNLDKATNGSQAGDVNILAVPTAGGPLQPYLREAAEFDWSRDGKRLV